jgi:hypothetical protein
MRWAIPPLPQYVFMAWCLVKHRDNFTFCLFTRCPLGLTQPLIQWVPGALSLGVKRPECEADSLPPYSAEVKEWAELYFHSPNTPSWRGAHLKHRDNFTLPDVLNTLQPLPCYGTAFGGTPCSVHLTVMVLRRDFRLKLLTLCLRFPHRNSTTICRSLSRTATCPVQRQSCCKYSEHQERRSHRLSLFTVLHFLVSQSRLGT